MIPRAKSDRPTVSAAFPLAGIAALALVASLGATPAQALTFENGEKPAAGRAGWQDLDYVDPAKKQGLNSEQNPSGANRGQSGFFFGSSQGRANQNFNPNQYFTPNNILGK